jgi:membrane protease YdiL (CAAX protease family)
LAIRAAPEEQSASRLTALLQLLVVLALAGAFLSIMSAYEAVNAGIWPKAFLVGRMAVLVLLCTWFLRSSGERWSNLGLRRPRRWWLVPLLALAGFVVLVVAANLIRDVLVPALGLRPPPPNPLTALRGDLPEYLFYATLVSWGSAAFGEEMLLRGFVLDRLLKVMGTSHIGAALVAVVVQAVVFGSLHLHQGANALVATAAGLVFGFVWLLGGRNLWACIALHGLVDLITYTNHYLGPGRGI